MAVTLLKGTAFLTGAGSGIGRATAIAFARSGIQHLALTDINEPSLKTVQEIIKKEYPDVEVETIQLNVRETDAVESSVLAAVKKFGRIDVAVNVAGIGGSGKQTHENTEEDWQRVLDVNLNGVWRSQKAQLKAMLKQEDLGPRYGRGNIINIASMYGIISPPTNIPATQYAASKHGVVGLTKGDAVSYAAHGIRINAICPGYIATPLLGNNPMSGEMTVEVKKTPMGRLGTVEEAADAIVFLASPMASFITGASLVVDGGHTVS
ncbi:short chain dehydrogenase reductase [Bisporella sp. PMI_857]|nr:short chain dehydrogenase reductase [Bisporella sp. PMI_857]